MRILHVLSANFFAGSVAYAIQLATVHQQQGHQVWLLSDSDALPTTLPQVRLPISNRRYGQRLRNIRRIRQLVQNEQIDVIHAHSRAASWVSYFALKGLKVALVSTVHGRQHLHASTSAFDMYGEKVIAICDNLQTHLVEEVRMTATKITAIPNGIAFKMLPEAIADAKVLRVAFIGRFNGGKGERAASLLQTVFPALLAEFPTLRLALIGGELEHLPEMGKSALATLQRQFGTRIEVIGFTTDVAGWMARTDLVIGAGRVAIEALGAGRAVLALGEASYAGLVTDASFAGAAASNFGDISAYVAPEQVDFLAIMTDAQTFLRAPAAPSAALQQQVRARYDLGRVATAVLEVYQSAWMRKALPSFIPVLMYHKIPDTPPVTKHSIYVTKERFAEHLAFFKRRKLTPITFVDYLQFASGEKSLAAFPKRPVVLTFDDGYTDNYTNLLPLMRQYGYRGVIYLLGDFDLRYNKWDLDADPTEPRAELMALAQKQQFVAENWEIGAHTMTHAHLPDLTPAAAAAEIRQSKQQLETVLQTPIVSFAYPYGDCNETVKQAVHEAGFAIGVATDTGGLHLEDDRMQVFRINMFPHESISSLRKKTSKLYRRYYRWKRKK